MISVTSSFTFRVIFDPEQGEKLRGKGRPRVTKWGTYTDAKTKAFEQAIRAAATDALGSIDPVTQPVRLTCIARKRRPISLCRKSYPEGHLVRTTRPDGDNIFKAVLDALDGLIYEDDKYIWEGIYRNEWADKGEHGHLIITVELMNGDLWPGR